MDRFNGQVLGPFGPWYHLFLTWANADTNWLALSMLAGENDAGPFGGFGMSGLGRELGEEGLDEFQETKHVHWDFFMEPKEWWYPYEAYNRAREEW